MIIRRNITIDYIFEQLKESFIIEVIDDGEKLDIKDIFLKNKWETFENEFEELINNIEEYKFIEEKSDLYRFLIKSNKKWYKLNYRVNLYTDYIYNFFNRKKVDCLKTQIEIYCVFNFEIHKEIIDGNGKNKEIVFISRTL